MSETRYATQGQWSAFLELMARRHGWMPLGLFLMLVFGLSIPHALGLLVAPSPVGWTALAVMIVAVAGRIAISLRIHAADRAFEQTISEPPPQG